MESLTRTCFHRPTATDRELKARHRQTGGCTKTWASCLERLRPSGGCLLPHRCTGIVCNLTFWFTSFSLLGEVWLIISGRVPMPAVMRTLDMHLGISACFWTWFATVCSSAKIVLNHVFSFVQLATLAVAVCVPLGAVFHQDVGGTNISAISPSAARFGSAPVANTLHRAHGGVQPLFHGYALRRAHPGAESL